MSIGTIKNEIAAYLQVAPSDLVINGVDLILRSLNNARKNAERLRDWNCEEVTVYGTAVAGVGEWMRTMQNVEDDEIVRLKQPETFYVVEGGYDVPLYHHSKKFGAVLGKEYNRDRRVGNNARYADDEGVGLRLFQGTSRAEAMYEVFMRGPKYELMPNPTVDKMVKVDGHMWLPDYVNDEDTDFFVEDGYDFLMWSGVVQCNMHTRTFVFRQEGNLNPPEKARDEAFATLVEHDNFIVEVGRQPYKR